MLLGTAPYCRHMTYLLGETFLKYRNFTLRAPILIYRGETKLYIRKKDSGGSWDEMWNCNLLLNWTPQICFFQLDCINTFFLIIPNLYVAGRYAWRLIKRTSTSFCSARTNSCWTFCTSAYCIKTQLFFKCVKCEFWPPWNPNPVFPFSASAIFKLWVRVKH